MIDDYDDSDFDDEFTGLDDGDACEDDSRVCPYCGEVAWNIDGSFVCDECGDIPEEEINQA